MIPKFRVYHEKYGMCQVNWMEFTLDKTAACYPFLLGGITTSKGKVIKECAVNPEKLK